MTDAEKLSLAYQLMAQDATLYPAVADALAQVEIDAAALLPSPPVATDVVQVRHLKTAGGGTLEHVEVLADGSTRNVGV